METLAVRRTRSRIALAMVTLGLVGAALLVTGRASAGQPTWVPTAAERQRALAAAHAEAATSIPGTKGARPSALADGTWPANVKSVMTVASTRKNAQQFVDGSYAEDDRRVVIVRMLGDFSVANTGPAGAAPFSTGHQMTIVVDAVTGEVLDFGLEPHPTASLHEAVQQFSR